MKWYKMDCDAQENLDMRKLVDEWGWDWYGRYWAIIGKIGMLVTEKRQTFALQTNNGSPFSVRLLANDLGTTVERLSDFCGFLADNRLIDKDSWYKKNLIYVPKLRERADEYTKKLLTKSRQAPEQEVEEEVEVEVDKKKNIHTPPIDCDSVMNQWNEFARTTDLPSVMALSDKRKDGIKARFQESQFDLPKIFLKIEASDFLRGKGGRESWKGATFDFVFLSKNNYLKILEGNYDNAAHRPDSKRGGISDFSGYKKSVIDEGGISGS